MEDWNLTPICETPSWYLGGVYVRELSGEQGPLLTLYRLTPPSDGYFLELWVDEVDGRDRWVCFQISAEQLEAYTSKKLTLKDIFVGTKSRLLFIWDEATSPLYDDRKYTSKVEDAPESIMPTEDSYYPGY